MPDNHMTDLGHEYCSTSTQAYVLDVRMLQPLICLLCPNICFLLLPSFADMILISPFPHTLVNLWGHIPSIKGISYLLAYAWGGCQRDNTIYMSAQHTVTLQHHTGIKFPCEIKCVWTKHSTKNHSFTYGVT